MSSSELIGSHVSSPQQLSTTGQQYGPRHQLRQSSKCTRALVCCASAGIATSGKMGKVQLWSRERQTGGRRRAFR